MCDPQFLGDGPSDSFRACVTLSFPPRAEHVRTARLVVVAVARRAGCDEDRLEEVRLVVGELCARAVRRSVEAGAVSSVTVQVDDLPPGLQLRVTDDAGEPELDPLPLSVVAGLADLCEVAPGSGGAGGVVTAGWVKIAP